MAASAHGRLPTVEGRRALHAETFGVWGLQERTRLSRSHVPRWSGSPLLTDLDETTRNQNQADFSCEVLCFPITMPLMLLKVSGGSSSWGHQLSRPARGLAEVSEDFCRNMWAAPARRGHLVWGGCGLHLRLGAWGPPRGWVRVSVASWVAVVWGWLKSQP